MTQFLTTLFAPIAAFALIAAAPAESQAQSAEGAHAAERFVAENAEAVIETLQAYHSGERELEAVKRDFRQRIDELAEVDRITNFVLGRYRRTADEETLEEFRSVFRDYAIGVYESELSNYAGQSLEVTGSVERRPGDYVVRSKVTGANGAEPVQVAWRVQERGGELKVLDAQIQGIWLAQTQRDQITSIIGDAGGDVTAAIDALRARMSDDGDKAGDAGSDGADADETPSNP